MTDHTGDVLLALEAAWNHLDARAAAATFAPDAVYVTRAGIAWHGRPAIERGFAKTLDGPLGDFTLTLRPLTTRALAPTVRVVVAEAHLTNDTTLMRATMTVVLTADTDGWLIASAHLSERPSIH